MTTVEESPFPTLQEIEEMSSQQIKLAHVNRVLPQTDNPTWKSELSKNDEIAKKDETIEASDAVENENEIAESNDASENISEVISTPRYIGHQIPEDFLIKAGLVGNDDDDGTQVQPLYKLNDDGSTRGKFDYFYV